jgi:putative ribosome biogenesis GTPase RsgA
MKDRIKFTAYLKELPEWDGIDHIKSLCNYLNIQPQDEYNNQDEYDANSFDRSLKYILYKFLERVFNCESKPKYFPTVLIGHQLIGKTTFINFLNPKGIKVIEDFEPAYDLITDACIIGSSSFDRMDYQFLDRFYINSINLNYQKEIDINKVWSQAYSIFMRDRK